MDLFKDIAKGKKFTKKGLKKEARHELKELGGKKHAEAVEKAIEKKKRCSTCGKMNCNCK